MGSYGLNEEHADLCRAFRRLVAEHKDLQARPVDVEEHRAHQARLHVLVDQLHTHRQRLRDRAQEPVPGGQEGALPSPHPPAGA